MPFINGKFYANPAYGEALERAKGLDSQYAGSEKQTVAASNRGKHGKQTATQGHEKPKVENEAAIGNRVYNETGGLRPKAGAKPGGPGSAGDLHNARVAMSDVIENRERSGKYTGVAPAKVKTMGRKTSAYGDSQEASAQTLGLPEVTGGSKNYYLDHGQPTPKWAIGKKTTAYGPFNNAAGGGDVPKGADVRIIVVHPEDEK